MNKIKSLSPSSFLRLLFAFFTLAFLIAAVVMPDRADMFNGLWRIASQTAKIPTNYFDPSYGGYAGTMLNAGCVALVCTALFFLPKAKANAASVIAFLLTVGFAFWGINVVNLWFGFFGVALYCLIKREALGSQVNAMIFTTGLAPLISDLLLAYPNAEAVGWRWEGFALALFIGLIIGFFLPAGLAHSPKVHKGFDLYSAAVPIGMTAFFLRSGLYQVLGVERGTTAVGPTTSLTYASWPVTNIFCFVVFGLCIVFALLMGCRWRDYRALLREPGHGADFSQSCGTAATLMNVGVFGLFIVLYYNVAALLGGSDTVFNAVTFGCIFCMLATCCSGSHPRNVWPILIGYIAASFACQGLALLIGGSFSQGISAQAILVGVCFANGLSPISGKYGWPFGILAGMLHYVLVTSVPLLHGGFCLYNGGFTAAFTCILLVPVLERFCKTREERLAVKK